MAIEGIGKAYMRFLVAWVRWVTRWARGVVLGGLVLTIAALAYFIDNVKINTSTSDMLSRDLPFRQKAEEIDAAFPQTDSTIAVVIDGQTADIADDAALILAAALRRQPNLFTDVYDLKGEAFFRRNGLLYLDLDELNDVGDRLAESQPFLSTLWRDSSLRGFFHMLGLALDDARESGGTGPLNLAAALNDIAAVAEAQGDKRFHLLSWTKLMGGDDLAPGDRRRVIIVKPVLDFSSLQPGSTAIDAIRRLASDLRLTPERGLRVRLTGSAALDEEELESVETGMGMAAAISFVLVLGLLLIGLRSLPLVAANLATLVAGLIWTAAFAILAIGTLNLISVAFAVLFIGLSVDFGIHFALRYREELWRGYDQADALAEAARGVGGALTLCALSAAAAFYAFLPTDYVGLAELGLIAGTGMFIALFANLTILPAFIALWPMTGLVRGARPSLSDGRFDLSPGLIRHARVVCGVSAVLGLAALVVVPRTEFDFDPLNLKDPETESVSTLLDLIRDGGRHHHTIDILAADLDEADRLVGRLEELQQVDKAVTLSSYVADDQEEKLAVVGDLALFVAPALAGADRQPALAGEDRIAAWRAIEKKLRAVAAGQAGDLGKAAGRLLDAMNALMRASSAGAVLLEFENRLLTGLPGRLDALNQSLAAETFDLAALPEQLRRRNVAADGRALIEVYPCDELTDRDKLAGFVAAVRTVAPDAVGSPVVILEAGRTVLGAFFQAFATAVVAIAVLLIVVLRRARDVVMVFVPLVLAALWTLALAVALGVAFNLANVIVLPLLFGLGVAGGIHVVTRSRDNVHMSETMQTSTPRAVMFSALTTIGSFGSISLSAHPGTASMGVLLTIAITMTLVAMLVFLPALLVVVNGGEGRREA